MEQETTRGKKKSTCPMHPEVQSDEPGNGPKCGMKLVEKEKKSKHQTKNDILKLPESIC